MAASHADRLLDHDDALVRLVAGNGVAIDALGFFAEPFEEGGGVAISPLASASGLPC